MKQRKRFYKTVSVSAHSDSGTSLYSIELDGRTIKTPERHALVLPYHALALAIAAEWDAQLATIDPLSMPMMRLVATTLDQIAVKRAGHIALLSAYIDTDLLCYRAQNSALARTQAQAWDPLIIWAQQNLGFSLACTDSILPLAQAPSNKPKAEQMLDALDDWQLSAMAVFIRTTGSFVMGFALKQGAITPEHAADIADLEGQFQHNQWGIDAEAQAVMQQKRIELVQAQRFLTLLN